MKVCINYLVKPEKIQTFPSDLSRAAYLNFRRMGRIFFLVLLENLSICCVFQQLKWEQNYRMMIFESPSLIVQYIYMVPKVHTVERINTSETHPADKNCKFL